MLERTTSSQRWQRSSFEGGSIGDLYIHYELLLTFEKPYYRTRELNGKILVEPKKGRAKNSLEWLKRVE